MSGTNLTIRHLCFTGPDKEPALLEFGPGLNVIYGASETGKSFVLEAIDFMLGSSKNLRDIPERVGYDRIWLGIQTENGDAFTLQRSASGGRYSCYEGLHLTPLENENPISLAAKHSPTNDKNISTFLLGKIGLAGKKIRRNARGDTNNLSFRNLCHLCLVGEGSIQKEGSPIETGQVMTRTSEQSAFKLLLTGVDDSALQSETRSEKEKLTRSAKVEVIDELISDYQQRLTALSGEEDDVIELSDQLDKLNGNLSKEQSILHQTERNYREALQRKNGFRKKLETAGSRRNEVAELIARFELLDQQYQSDLGRLEGIREAGTLISALDTESCPLCGATSDTQHLSGDCDGNVDSVVIAASAESTKIVRLRQELGHTVSQLRSEENQFDLLMPNIRKDMEDAENKLKAISPTLSDQRSAYTEVLEKRTTVQNALNIICSITELQERRLNIEDSPSSSTGSTNNPAGDLSASTLDKFSSHLEQILKSWNFPEPDRVHFDRTNRDFVISGKPRGSRGKGMRALTHTAFTIALIEYTELNGLCHPGFTVLDTPLLAYREPEGEEDDLSGTDVKDKLYAHLEKLNSRQVIILENDDPPEGIKRRSQTIFFSKNPHQGRYGFLPHI